MGAVCQAKGSFSYNLFTVSIFLPAYSTAGPVADMPDSSLCRHYRYFTCGCCTSVLCQFLDHTCHPGHILQCSSEISEPKHMSKMCIIRVFVYTHTSIDTCAYTYKFIRVCVISMYELAYCFFYCGKVIVDFYGHCNCSENWWSSCMSVNHLVFIPAVCLLTAVRHYLYIE